MNGDRLIVRGVEVIPQPYSPKRYKQFQAVQDEINKYLSENASMTIDEVPDKLKGKWWKAKGDILWSTANGVELDEAFYAHEDFPSGLLKRVEGFFLIDRLYL
jgi:hypothetical protein